VRKEDLRQIRKDLELTQAELAWRVGLDRNTVARLEVGLLPIRKTHAVLYSLIYYYWGKELDKVIRRALKPKVVVGRPRRRTRRRR
jgi:predicted transcriptional regulator